MKRVISECVQSPSHVQLSAALWTVASQASRSLTISQSLPKSIFLALVMLYSHLIFWRSLLLLPSIFPSTRDFSNELSESIRWPKYWSFSFSISPSSDYTGLISLEIHWFDLLAVQGTLKSLLQHHSSRHQFFGIQPSLRFSSHNHTWTLGRPQPWLYGPLSAE